jgi:carboxylesterase
MNVFSVLPDTYTWWDPERQAEGGLPHAYPRYSRRGLVQILRLGFASHASAQRVAPRAKRIVVVTNANDTAVNNELTMQVVNAWQAHAANLTLYEFAADLGLDHDLIDPLHPAQNITLVYPRLIELVTHP